MFLLFSLLPLFSKKGVKKTGIRSCQSARALLTSRKRHSSVARALLFAAGRKHCGAAQLAALKHITACFLVLLGGSLCHLRQPQYLTLPLLRLRAVLQRSASVCACRGRNKHTPPLIQRGGGPLAVEEMGKQAYSSVFTRVARKSTSYLRGGAKSNKHLRLQEGSAEPKNGLNERNVSLLTDCSASETFFDEVKALHCFQRK